MKVLILGSGGREHALAWAIQKSERVKEVVCAPGNGGMAQTSRCVPADLANLDSMVAAVEKAIRTSELGLNPSSDGKVVRIPIPQLTEDRRKELVKRAHHIAEESRTAIRQVRRDGNDRLKKMLKGHEISEDDEKRALDEIQKMTDKHIEEVGGILKHKEQDIMAV